MSETVGHASPTDVLPCGQAVVGTIGAEEAAELAGQVQELQAELRQQDSQHQQLQQEAKVLCSELSEAQAQLQQQQQVEQLLAAADARVAVLEQQLVQQAADADDRVQTLQQRADQADEQVRQLQAQLLQQQQEYDRLVSSQGSRQSASAGVEQQLAAMSRQVDESVILATQAERQKKDLAAQVRGDDSIESAADRTEAPLHLHPFCSLRVLSLTRLLSCQLQVAMLTQQLDVARESLQQQQKQHAAASAAAAKPTGADAGQDVATISSMVLDLRSKLAAAEQKASVAEKQVRLLAGARRSSLHQPFLFVH